VPVANIVDFYSRRLASISGQLLGNGTRFGRNSLKQSRIPASEVVGARGRCLPVTWHEATGATTWRYGGIVSASSPKACSFQASCR